MPLKIFVSYRRQDTAASAVGIGQYLEKEFGNKNVYIDVETHAGAKYASVIEKHLAECRVLLVLIGPDWLKLQKPNDWVQREIAYALRRDITVIPVLIDGAQLPDQELLPDDIKGLVDHQAASVSLAGFRHEMAGLVKDIRSFRTPKPWRLLGALTAAISLSLIAGIFVHSFGFYNLLERIRPLKSSPGLASISQNSLWSSRPGEWIMYGVDKNPVAYFLNATSTKVLGDTVAFSGRYPLQQSSGQGVYEDETQVLDCKKSVFLSTERTIYNNAGEIIFHFKSGEPESADLSNGTAIPAGSVLALAQHVLCDEQLRALLHSKAQLNNVQLSYLANAPDGDGNVLYGPIKKTSNPTFPIEVLFVDKKNGDHGLANVFPGQNVRGLPPSYRAVVQNVQINCVDRKILVPALRYYDGGDNLIYLATQSPTQPADVTKGSIFERLLESACGASALNVTGSYYGMNYIRYGNKARMTINLSY
jgi:hypothetical protein